MTLCHRNTNQDGREKAKGRKCQSQKQTRGTQMGVIGGGVPVYLTAREVISGINHYHQNDGDYGIYLSIGRVVPVYPAAR